ncbi:MAG: hypothetical protein CR978_01085 [Gammaproteobacteria bacterium]|nr:MAG: hypothetical protein CR978_01085 [Gammaproteobacteria bacterium]
MSGIFRLAKDVEGRLSLEEPTDCRRFSACFMEHLRNDSFPERCVLAGHFDFDFDIAERLRSQGFIILVLLRNPYTNLQALYQQAQTKMGLPSCKECMAVKNMALEGDEMVEFASKHFGSHLRALGEWLAYPHSLSLNVEYFDIAPDDISKLILNLQSDDTSSPRRLVGNKETVNNWAHMEAYRLPMRLVGEVNKVLPQSYWGQGYKIRSENLGDELNSVMRGFSEYIDSYSEKKHVFIVGNGKSGTTWLHLAFFSHPNVAALAERRLYEHPDNNVGLFDQWLDKTKQASWFESSSFGKRFPEKKSIFAELQRVVSDYLAYRDLSMVIGEDGLNRNTPVTHVSEKIALTNGADASAVMQSLAETYPDASIVHIVRDPRDVAISTLFHVNRERTANSSVIPWMSRVVDGSKDNIGIRDRIRFSAFCKSKASAWASVVGAFHTNGQRMFGDSYEVLRYEDLLANPRDSLYRVFSSVQLDASDENIERVVQQTSFQKITKGRKAGQQDSSSFYRKGVAGDWKNYLADSEWQASFSSCLTLMSEFGYL